MAGGGGNNATLFLVPGHDKINENEYAEALVNKVSAAKLVEPKLFDE